ncbi:malto-oligosyltrehalose trehalohydrolase [Gordonia desulfuricans]|uniref:Malto-oligosyltrehalose trehalohydrolase n=1 Tax=Gordonia desulfuricans TaxID=89051 RepID=A0A7K3LQH5_9ACTN|nr:malto-oligosyltrehalose trehalohydrolase [Gordonia desulfuricans]
MSEPQDGRLPARDHTRSGDATITIAEKQSGQKRPTRCDTAPTRPFRPPRTLDEVRVWAPSAQRLHLVVDTPNLTGRSTVAMLPDDEPGWYRPDPGALAALGVVDGPGLRYGFVMAGVDDPVPDPRSARLPEGIHGLSALFTVDDAVWHDAHWAGRDVRGAVIYELHIGTFTPDGTFDAAIAHLDDLVDLGVDLVEPLPVNAFNGTHNWGYDGVGWYAVQETYGGPEAFARFVDACHVRGLGVVLDVVYNHLGPSGNHLSKFGPYLGGSTGWGASLNLDGPDSDEVRRFIVENALRWFDEFHVDALRLDAVHALVDHRAVHLLEALAEATDALSAEVGRPLSLIAESDLNDPRLFTPREAGGYGLTAQWDDDIHHVIHTAVSGERQGYYADFGSLESLSKVLRGGFFHDGTYSSFRGRHHGRPIPPTLPTTALLAYTCDHDQIGNRAIGDRPTAYLDAGQIAIKAALVLLSPFTPMLFMGEEWAARTPFQYFTSHPEPELGQATARGRKAEFAAHGWDADDIPDPQDPQTFLRSKLDWSERELPEHAAMLAFYRDLISLRKTEPAFAGVDFGSTTTQFDEDARWFAMFRGRWAVVCNLGEDAVDVGGVSVSAVRLGWGEYDVTPGGLRLGGHSVAIGPRRPTA